MPARSTVAAPDAELQSEIRTLKAKVSELDNANVQLKKDLGAAQKDQADLAKLKNDHKALQATLDSARAEINHLNADLVSARSKGASDSELVSAAKDLASAVKRLS